MNLVPELKTPRKASLKAIRTFTDFTCRSPARFYCKDRKFSLAQQEKGTEGKKKRKVKQTKTQGN